MSVKVTIRDTPDGRRFKRMLQELSKLEVRVGFQAGEAQEDDGTDICEVAAYNELGTEHIPARPFLRKSVDENVNKINSFMKAKARWLDGAHARPQTGGSLRVRGGHSQERPRCADGFQHHRASD